MDLLQKTRRLLEDEDFGSVRDMLKSYVRSSDNIGLLHAAALADCGLGNAEAGLEKANKALRFNPNQADGLAIRGLALFLSGETEKGASLMQDAYGRDKENKRIKKDHMRCSKTLSLVTKGRSCVKRGRYMDAVEHFTSAIKESSKISEKTVLYGMLRTERAEAWMLSDKYLEALKDCQEVINAQRENAAAWTVRAEVLIALGKAEEAKKELAAIRKSWGAENQTIEEGYRRVDFEMRVLKEDRDLIRFIKDLDRGLGGDTVEPLQDTRRSETRGERTSSRNRDPHDRRAMMKQTSSRRLLNGDHRQISSRRLHENGDRQKSSRRLLENGDRQPSSRRLENGDRQPSSRRFLENGDRQPSSRRLTESGHRQTSSRRLVNNSSNEDDRRLAMMKAKSSRRMTDGDNSSNNLNGSRQKKRPNGLDRKSMSERNFDTSKQRPSSVKRT
jgi:Flp pilus assembly protein TadD